MRKVWHIGNTTVRTPYRLKAALSALANSRFAGSLVGRDQETGFARLLHESGIVDAPRIERGGDSDFSDLGRKWRSALSQLGFTTPKTCRILPESGLDPVLVNLRDLPGLTGRPFEISPNGSRLASAETLSAQQECFLRSLLVYSLPSIVESSYECAPFSPLRIVLRSLTHLAGLGFDPYVSMEEMASVIQATTSEDDIAHAVESIQSYRRDREAANNKPVFDHEFRVRMTGAETAAQEQTLLDYADLNFRYLKATGLFVSHGRGLALASDKARLIESILQAPFAPLDDVPYLRSLCSGARLPTDNREDAIQIIGSLARLLSEKGERVELPQLEALQAPELNQIRLRLEDRIRQLREETFSATQREKWEEILAYIKSLAGERGGVRVPKGEAPAYLEWTIWRAFLAIDTMLSKPWECRRFQVDQDFVPISVAAGGGPDMVFEFEHFVLVVEVTLTTSSRQEAAEGEPVRRHVAAVLDQFSASRKRVYGLFIANEIDSNTAETFRIGGWYKRDDTRVALAIVPLTLQQFADLFRAGFSGNGLPPDVLERLLTDCRAISNNEAPEWKRLISREVARTAEAIVPH